MKNLDVYIFSQSDITRYVVIDHSVLIEEILSTTIANLLDIDLNKPSKALGHTSGALSFSQKILLMKDIIGDESLDSKKLDAFLQIRNKFAHVKAIDTWQAFSELSDTYKKIITNLSEWYKSEINNEITSEDSTRLLYYHLTRDIFYFLFQTNMDWAYKKGLEAGSNEAKTALLDLVKEKAHDSAEIKELWLEFNKKILSNNNGFMPTQE